MWAVFAKVAEVAKNLGKDSDTSSSTGSVHAKLKDVRLWATQAPLMKIGDLSGSVLNNLALVSNRVIFGNYTLATRTSSSGGTSTTSEMQGITITTNKILHGIKIRLSTGSGTRANRFLIQNSAGTTTIASAIGTSGGYVEIILPDGLPVGTYRLRTDASGATYNTSYDFTPSITSPDFTVNSYDYSSSLITDFREIHTLTLSSSATSGTLTKTINITDLNSYGAIYFAKDTPSGTNIVCDVLSASNSVLISNVQHAGDISSINVFTHPTIKIRFTFTKSSSPTPSPSLRGFSYSWLGGES